MNERASRTQVIERLAFIFLPVVVAIIITALLRKRVDVNFLKEIDETGLYQTMLSLWGTMLGFIFATAAILVSVNETSFIKELKDSGNFRTVLITYISSCVHIFFALVITTFLYVLNIWSRGWMLFIIAANIDVFITIGLTIIFFAVMIVREK